MEKRIREICEELCCKDLQPDEQLISTKLLNSFKIMELICELEEEFHIIFEPDEITNLDHFSCIAQIVTVVEKKLAGEEVNIKCQKD